MKNILYIEDDENLARLLARRMERHGFSVTIAPTGEDGLQTLGQNGSPFDIVLIDHHLPGKSGLEILSEITASMQAAAPPCIVLTASGDERLAISALEKGAADYAIKDVNLSYIDLLPAIMQAAFTKTRLQRENEQHQKELVVARDKAEMASQAKTDFLAMMSHEIRTPMNVVVGLANLLGETQLDDKQREMIGTLKASADLLLTLINDLLDLNRIESGQMQLERNPFSLSAVTGELTAMFDSEMKRKNLSFSVVDRAPPGQFLGDRTRLQQVLMNLTGNAVKFTEKGGITVTIDYKPELDGRHWLTMAVTDTGIGIAAEKLPQIFDKFVQADNTITRRFGGSGLGLAICRSIARAMGGEVRVTSLAGHGSTFALHVPLEMSKEAVPAPVTAPVAHAQPASSGGSKTILLVEDYPANVMVATMMLENLGFHVDSATSGGEALAKIRAAVHPYAAILMDVQMYDMDGYETTRRLRLLEAEKGMRHHIIGVTAHALAGDREKCLDAGMDDYMSKPINPDILQKKLVIFGGAAPMGKAS